MVCNEISFSRRAENLFHAKVLSIILFPTEITFYAKYCFELTKNMINLKIWNCLSIKCYCSFQNVFQKMRNIVFLFVMGSDNEYTLINVL